MDPGILTRLLNAFAFVFRDPLSSARACARAISGSARLSSCREV